MRLRMILEVKQSWIAASGALSLRDALADASVRVAPGIGHPRADLPQGWEEALPHALLEELDGAALERSRAHSDRAVDQKDMVAAEFLHQLIELHQTLGDPVCIVVRV